MSWVKAATLRSIREMLGLSRAEVERQSLELIPKYYPPVTRQELEDWESGIATPDLAQLETLSEIYGCPVGFFFLEKPPSLSFLRRMQKVKSG